MYKGKCKKKALRFAEELLIDNKQNYLGLVAVAGAGVTPIFLRTRSEMLLAGSP